MSNKERAQSYYRDSIDKLESLLDKARSEQQAEIEELRQVIRERDLLVGNLRGEVERMREWRDAFVSSVVRLPPKSEILGIEYHKGGGLSVQYAAPGNADAILDAGPVHVEETPLTGILRRLKVAQGNNRGAIETIYERAHRLNGVDYQWRKLAEESAELATAALQYIERRNGTPLVCEIADVLFMLEEMALCIPDFEKRLQEAVIFRDSKVSGKLDAIEKDRATMSRF